MGAKPLVEWAGGKRLNDTFAMITTLYFVYMSFAKIVKKDTKNNKNSNF